MSRRLVSEQYHLLKAGRNFYFIVSISCWFRGSVSLFCFELRVWVCVCVIFWGFVCFRYRITKRLMVNSYVNVLFFILSTNFMVIGLKIIEPNINNKIFPYCPVLCSCFKAHTSDVKRVIQEDLEILRKVRSVSSKCTFLVPIPTDRHSGALRA